MPMNTPTILLYNLDNPRGAKIRRMCLSLRLRTALVPRESYGLPLGAVVIPALFVPPAFLCHGREAGLLALILALIMLSRHIRGLGRILRGEEERKFRGR